MKAETRAVTKGCNRYLIDIKKCPQRSIEVCVQGIIPSLQVAIDGALTWCMWQPRRVQEQVPLSFKSHITNMSPNENRGRERPIFLSHSSSHKYLPTPQSHLDAVTTRLSHFEPSKQRLYISYWLWRRSITVIMLNCINKTLLYESMSIVCHTTVWFQSTCNTLSLLQHFLMISWRLRYANHFWSLRCFAFKNLKREWRRKGALCAIKKSWVLIRPLHEATQIHDNPEEYIKCMSMIVTYINYCMGSWLNLAQSGVTPFKKSAHTLGLSSQPLPLCLQPGLFCFIRNLCFQFLPGNL